MGGTTGITTGAARNTALLLAAGSRLLLCDDDVRGSVQVAPTWQEPPQFDDPPHERTRYADVTSGWEPASFTDALGQHLGARIGADIRATGSDASGLARRTIRLTVLGVRGDPGTSTQVWRLLDDDPLARTGAEVVRAATRPRVDVAGRVLATAIGVDASTLVPPFPPVGRNQDGAFATILMLGVPRSAMLFVPGTVAHRPGRPRPISLAPPPWRINDIIARIVVGARVRPSLDVLAGALRESDLHAPEQLCRWRDQELRALQDALAARAPDPDRERALKDLEELQRRSDRWIPSDLSDSNAAADLLATRLARYADLLDAWPALWDAARELRLFGGPIARDG